MNNEAVLLFEIQKTFPIMDRDTAFQVPDLQKKIQVIDSSWEEKVNQNQQKRGWPVSCM